ncbi:carbohydrate-binding family 9-like protein [Coraliomargarita sp. SDUM461004]|uniref:Carbohydrate-binding family 9-like protein n=1 Tax=Thalassobacterium sedimentorum TaxID=3041258 RepID=A0ABU1AH62_9BACT|nr:carbohydrate-binding family 9-like protein [Coraliomargarita sp. SDUM461004]MDQ8194047.1 carbohydrate-binding family 9-like protein [Coraliomargarita sp. SDUM461004]
MTRQNTPTLVSALLIVTCSIWGTGCQSTDMSIRSQSKTPVLDLRQDPPALVELFDHWNQSSDFLEPTIIKVRANSEYLWIDYYASDRSIESTHTDRDSETFRDDCVEIFIAAPEAHPSTAIGIEMNTNGAISDYRYTERNRFDHSLDLKGVQNTCSPIEAFPENISLKGPGYNHSIRLQLSEIYETLQVSKNEKWLRINFARWNTTGKKRTFTIWSDSDQYRPHPHNTKRYGWIRLP